MPQTFLNNINLIKYTKYIIPLPKTVKELTPTL